MEKAKELDRRYIPTRYPNFHPEGAPMDFYTKKDAERAVRYAKEIIESVKVRRLDYDGLMERLKNTHRG